MWRWGYLTMRVGARGQLEGICSSPSRVVPGKRSQIVMLAGERLYHWAISSDVNVHSTESYSKSYAVHRVRNLCFLSIVSCFHQKHPNFSPLKRFVFILCVRVFWLQVYLCTPCKPGGQRRELYPLDLESQTVLSHHGSAESWTQICKQQVLRQGSG